MAVAQQTNSNFIQKNLKALARLIYATLIETKAVAVTLFKILIPVIILVKILDELSFVSVIAQGLSPIMQLIGLRGEFGIVWAAAMFTNLYGGIATLLTIFPQTDFSIQEMTIICSMMLLCHALPVELALMHKVGGNFLMLGLLRFFGALVYGFILNQTLSNFDHFQELSTIHWIPQSTDPALSAWLIDQIYNLLFTLVVLFCLLLLMRILNYFKVTDFLARLMSPLLKLIGISQKASMIIIFGLLAGITFGSGLLLAEVKKNEIDKREVLLALIFLSLCHGVIEDTSLMLLLGGSIYGILIGRVLLALIVVIICSRLILTKINND